MTQRVVATILALLMAGCVAESPRTSASLPSRTPDTTPQTGSGASRSDVSPRPTREPVRLETLVLTADLTEEPVAWDLVTTIPFGRRKSELRLQLPPQHAPNPISPLSFAVQPDGTLWFLDALNHRLAHFDSTGEFLGSVRGLLFNRFVPTPQDIAFVDGDLLYITRSHGNWVTRLRSVRQEEFTDPILVTNRGELIVVRYALASASGPVVDVEGFAGTDDRTLLQGGPDGFGSLTPQTGHVAMLPGAPVGEHSFMNVGFVPGHERDLEVRMTTGTSVTILPIHLKTAVTKRGRLVPIPALASIEKSALLPHGMAVYFHVGPVRSKDLKYGGGRWVLEIFDDGSPMVWERVPEPPVSDENTIRHLASTPNGDLYMMFPTFHGMEIYRRPAPAD